MHDREDALPVPVNVQMIICQPFGLIGKNKNQKILGTDVTGLKLQEGELNNKRLAETNYSVWL